MNFSNNILLVLVALIMGIVYMLPVILVFGALLFLYKKFWRSNSKKISKRFWIRVFLVFFLICMGLSYWYSQQSDIGLSGIFTSGVWGITSMLGIVVFGVIEGAFLFSSFVRLLFVVVRKTLKIFGIQQ